MAALRNYTPVISTAKKKINIRESIHVRCHCCNHSHPKGQEDARLPEDKMGALHLPVMSTHMNYRGLLRTSSSSRRNC